MNTEPTSVLNGRLPEIRTTEPNSPSARPRASPAPEMIAGASEGRITRLNVVSGPAPSDAAACSTSASSSISTGCTARTTNGSVTNSSANRTAPFVKAMSTGAGPLGPYSASSVRPATMVGNANGRSITELTSDLPGNSSRTRTHAINVPGTAFTTATTIDINSVNLSAATASRLDTAVQKPSRPLSVLAETSAASGNRTITLSHTMEMPSSGGRMRPRRCGRATA